jgi:hypothetical protein
MTVLAAANKNLHQPRLVFATKRFWIDFQQLSRYRMFMCPHYNAITLNRQA